MMELLDIILNFSLLAMLEIILGIDNVIFISLLVMRLREEDRFKIRFVGIALALILRVLFLFGASIIMTMREPLFSVLDFPVSGRTLILLFGGLFLVIKGALEMKELFSTQQEKSQSEESSCKIEADKSYKWQYFKIIVQIIFIDLVLSFDSVLVALAMTDQIMVIIAAITLAMIAMLLSAGVIGEFIEKYPSIKVIAIAFIMLIGVFLTLNSVEIDVPKAYLYFAMLFSMTVEMINIALSKKHKTNVR